MSRERIEELETALRDLVVAVTAEVNRPRRGGSGYLLARLSDAREALGMSRSDAMRRSLEIKP